MLAPAPHRDLEVRPAEERVERTGFEVHRGGSAAESVQLIELSDGPRLDPERELVREDLRIAGDIEGAPGNDSGRLMLAVSVARGPGKDGEDHMGPEGTDHPGDVPQQLLLRPVPERLLGRLRVPEVERASEELDGAVDRAGRDELPGPDEAEPLAELAPDQILAAVAARQREIGCSRSVSPGERRENGGVLIIRMRRDHEHPLRPIELTEEKPGLDDAGRRSLDLREPSRRKQQREVQRQGNSQQPSAGGSTYGTHGVEAIRTGRNGKGRVYSGGNRG